MGKNVDKPDDQSHHDRKPAASLFCLTPPESGSVDEDKPDDPSVHFFKNGIRFPSSGLSNVDKPDDQSRHDRKPAARQCSVDERPTNRAYAIPEEVGPAGFEASPTVTAANSGDLIPSPSITDQVKAKVQDVYKKYTVAVVFTVFIVLRACDNVFMKRLSFAPTPYFQVFVNLIWPFFITVMFGFWTCIYICWKRFYEKDERYGPGFLWIYTPLRTEKTPEQLKQIKWYLRPGFRFLFLVILQQQFSNVFSSAPQTYLNFVLYSLIKQAGTLGFCLMLTFILLKTRYRQTHYLGMFLSVVGVGVQLIPYIQTPPGTDPCDPDTLNGNTNSTAANHEATGGNCFHAYKNTAGSYVLLSTGAMIMWLCVELFSWSGLASSLVHMEAAFKTCNMDIAWFSWMQAPMNLLLGIIFTPTMLIPWPDAQHVSGKDFFKVIGWTWDCFVNSKDTGPLTQEQQDCSSQSLDPVVVMFLYFCFNLFFNILMAWLLKNTSAIWMQVGNGCVQVLGQILCQFEPIAGKNGKYVLRFSDWTAIIVSITGFWLYNLYKEHKKKGTAEEEQELLRQQDSNCTFQFDVDLENADSRYASSMCTITNNAIIAQGEEIPH